MLTFKVALHQAFIMEAGPKHELERHDPEFLCEHIKTLLSELCTEIDQLRWESGEDRGETEEVALPCFSGLEEIGDRMKALWRSKRWAEECQEYIKNEVNPNPNPNIKPDRELNGR